MNSRNLGAALALLLALIGRPAAEEIQYVETFALAEDRDAALQQLIPGTDEYYYYHCLHFQHTQQFEKADALLGPWIERHGQTERARRILHRQALLRYDRDPQKTLEYLRQTLNLRFEHQRTAPNQRPDLPTKLDPALISRQTLTDRALAQHRNLQGFENSAFEWLIDRALDRDRARELLQRIERPDHTKLVDLVAADLDAGTGFGVFPIHRHLLTAQLDELAKKKPVLLSNNEFVQAYLQKLRPAAGVDWTTDPAVRLAYLERQWAFVEQLPPAFNSLKANILYHRLVHDRSQGVHDRERFLLYLQLPRSAPYMRPEYLQGFERAGQIADLNAAFIETTQLAAIVNDEPLVRAYLQHFFVEDTTYQPFVAYVKEEYLRHVFAETKIVNGLGDSDQWLTWLPPAQIQALKDRVDIDFAATNKSVLAVSDPVRLDVYVKNVSTLIVKVFEINTTNFYRQNGREIDTDINLDGLTPNWEDTYNYEDSPLRRIRRTFEFPELARRGVYVVDFIGNGKSSRVLVRKGQLRYLARSSTAGHVFTVLDEQNHPLPDAETQLGGQRFTSNQEGEIAVPYSTNPGLVPIILVHGGFSTLERFQHAAEQYRLEAAIYVDRESLLRSRRARILIRPRLYVNNSPVALSVLKNVRLSISSTDLDGVQATLELPDFKLFEDRESVHEIQVPPRLAQLQVSLSADVRVVSTNKDETLADSANYQINGIDRSDAVEDLHLVQASDGYSLELLGRTGEQLADRAVTISLKHRDFRDLVQVALKSDADGRIQLGTLPGIDQLTATLQNGVNYSWTLHSDRQDYTGAVHGETGSALQIPYPGDADGKADRTEFSLLEIRDGTFSVDRFHSLSLSGGMLQVQGLPPGDYDLWMKKRGVRLQLRVAEGETWNGYVLGKNRLLEVRQPDPVSIESIEQDDEQLRITLRNAGQYTRVHILATRYVPQHDEFQVMSAVHDARPQWASLPTPQTLFIEGRNIGDEYRYIIDRKYASKFPGNMLARPSLLLNPWPVRDTQTSTQEAAAGDDFGAAGAAPAAERPAAAPADQALREAGGYSNLDFLAGEAVVLVNLKPNASGQIVVPREALGDHILVRVVVLDPLSTASQSVALKDVELVSRDLRLTNALDPQKHYLQQKQVTLINKGQPFVIEDIASSRFEAYDSLSKVYQLLSTLSSDARLDEFRFVLEWQTLDTAKKDELYSKFACHELNFFILQKDPEFFENVVRPYLRNKREKQFLDRWLLGDEVREYAIPWRYAQLNTVERVLLAQRLQQIGVAAQEIQNHLDVTPVNIDELARLVDAALQVEALQDAEGFEEAKAILERENVELFSRRARGGGMGAGGAALAEYGAVDRAESARKLATLRDKVEKESANLGVIANGEQRNRFLNDMDGALREQLQQLFVPVDKTKEWAENHYYHLPLDQQTAALVGYNPFWLDFVKADAAAPFFSEHFPRAASNFTEIMFVLSVLDLPATSPEHETEFAEGRMTLTASGPVLVFHEQVQEAPLAEEGSPLLVSQSFFRHADRHEMVGGQRVDKFVTGEFLVHTVYGCRIVVTNPTSAAQQFDVLLQIPQGAVPLASARYTRSVRLQLDPYNTQTIEYLFYFPFAGSFPHFPVHLGRDQKVVVAEKPFQFNVVEQLSTFDRQSWEFVSQDGSEEEVLTFLRQRNLVPVDLSRIAWRMRDGVFFDKAISELARRHMYDHVLWSYAVLHNVPSGIGEFLQHDANFVAQCGPYLSNSLLTLDPVERHSFAHLEYKPLINARAHPLGRNREILNDRFHQQYHQLMEILSLRPSLDDGDRMAVTYYLLLQDRIAEGIASFGKIDPANIETRVQYDYLSAYVDFYNANPQRARQIAASYASYPVARWRDAFSVISSQLSEIDGGRSGIIDPLDRDQVQSQLAATAPAIEIKLEGKDVVITYQNVPELQLNFYEMDIELLFSRNPFVQEFSGQFSYIRPNVTHSLKLPPGQTQTRFALPEALHNRNVLVEAVSAGQTRTAAYYSNSMVVQMSDNYGQLRVLNGDAGTPLPKVYVKVYARLNDGRVKFYKDGYTDLRGRFDYVSLSTSELDAVQRFSLLVLSDEHGAVVREAGPPQR